MTVKLMFRVFTVKYRNFPRLRIIRRWVGRNYIDLGIHDGNNNLPPHKNVSMVVNNFPACGVSIKTSREGQSLLLNCNQCLELYGTTEVEVKVSSNAFFYLCHIYCTVLTFVGVVVWVVGADMAKAKSDYKITKWRLQSVRWLLSRSCLFTNQIAQ